MLSKKPSEDTNSIASDSDDSDRRMSDEDVSSAVEDIELSSNQKTTETEVQNPFFDHDSASSSDVSVTDTESEFDSGSDSEDGGNENTLEEGSEDPLIKALKAAKEKKKVKERDAPPDLKFSNEVTDISFHPQNNLLSVSLIDGQIDIFSYTNEENILKKRLKIHKHSVRTLEFDVPGTRVFSGSAGKGEAGTIKITDVETSQVVFKAIKCHPSPLYKVKPMTEHLFASGKLKLDIVLVQCL